MPLKRIVIESWEGKKNTATVLDGAVLKNKTKEKKRSSQSNLILPEKKKKKKS